MDLKWVVRWKVTMKRCAREKVTCSIVCAKAIRAVGGIYAEYVFELALGGKCLKI